MKFNFVFIEKIVDEINDLKKQNLFKSLYFLFSLNSFLVLQKKL